MSMYPKETSVEQADSLAEAAELLDEYGSGAHLLAGGQSLIPLMKLRLASPDVLIDVSHVTPDPKVAFEDDHVRIHALTKHAETIADEQLTATFDIIDDAVPQIADPQIRNMGTVGGSAAHADPSGDWGPLLLATKGTIHTVSPEDERTIPASEFYDGPFQTELDSAELIQSLSFPLPSDGLTGGAYLKIKRRQGVYAVASVGVQLSVDDGVSASEGSSYERSESDAVCTTFGVACNSVGADYVSPDAVEDHFIGEPLTEELIEAGARKLSDHLETVADPRGTEEYKRDACIALFERAIEVAHQRALGNEVEPNPMGQGVTADV